MSRCSRSCWKPEHSHKHKMMETHTAVFRGTFRTQIYPEGCSYLKHLLVQNPGPKHRDAVCADYRFITSVQRLGDFLLTVDDHGDGFLLHTDRHTVPPAQVQSHGKYKEPHFRVRAEHNENKSRINKEHTDKKMQKHNNISL